MILNGGLIWFLIPGLHNYLTQRGYAIYRPPEDASRDYVYACKGVGCWVEIPIKDVETLARCDRYDEILKMVDGLIAETEGK